MDTGAGTTLTASLPSCLQVPNTAMHVYYFSLSGNTKRFVERLGFAADRIFAGSEIVAQEPYVLLTPTYSGKVPQAVANFLDRPENRTWIRGVVTSGNTNFGADYAQAGRTISGLTGAPLLHSFELTGLPEDVESVREKMMRIDNG